MQTLTRDVDAAAVGNSDAYSLALATQARQKTIQRRNIKKDNLRQKEGIKRKLAKE